MSQALVPPRIERRAISVEEFLKMAETGILRKDERIELIQGEMIPMTPIGNRHVWVLALLDKQIRPHLDERQLVVVQGGLQLDEMTYVEPDLVVLQAEPETGNDPLPKPPDVLLLVEVSESSLRFDRETKLPLYARHRIPEVWILDVEAKTLASHSRPGSNGYASEKIYGPGDCVAPSHIPGASIDLAKVFR